MPRLPPVTTARFPLKSMFIASHRCLIAPASMLLGFAPERQPRNAAVAFRDAAGYLANTRIARR
jgi:hypothetical protein